MYSQLMALSEGTLNFLLTLRFIGFALLFLCSAIIIVAVIMQNSSADGNSGALTGQTTETYYAKNKGSTKEGKLRLITIICAIIIFVVAIGLVILFKPFQ